MVYDSLVTLGVLLQALAAIGLFIVARTSAASASASAESAQAIRDAAVEQAEAAQAQAAVARASFFVEFAGQQLAAADVLREEAYSLGLDSEAVELENASAGYFDLTIDSTEEELSPVLRRLVAANHKALKTIRNNQHAERQRIGRQGGAEP